MRRVGGTRIVLLLRKNKNNLMQNDEKNSSN
jgi:hypothetical protein